MYEFSSNLTLKVRHKFFEIVAKFNKSSNLNFIYEKIKQQIKTSKE
jgi:hypothetical protein